MSGGIDDRPPRPAGRPPAPAHAGGRGRPGPPGRPAGHAQPHARARQPRLAHPLGAARRRARPPSPACLPSARGCISSSFPRCSPASPTSSAPSSRRPAPRATGEGTLLFIDEIHRFNRAQQDGFLPVVENGTVTLIGATTENPSFALIGALLSRCQVLVLRRLDDDALDKLLERAEADAGRAVPLTARSPRRAARHGRRRRPLRAQHGRAVVRPAGRHRRPSTPPGWPTCWPSRAALYDKDREEHYNLISALHKSLRGSDPDAALYWYARMLTGGEDPRYIARRLVRFAVEDIGLADPNALPQALAAWEAYERLGSPGRRVGDRPGCALSRHRAQIERRLHRARRGKAAPPVPPAA